MNPSEFTGCGQLPDALAFVTPNRTACYLELARADGPLSATDLETRLECSSATVYRMLSDLEDIDVIQETVTYEPNVGPKAGYEPLGAQRARTDGGERE